jgi:hypothetical protein
MEPIALLAQEATEFGCAELLALPGILVACISSIPGCLCALPGLPGAICALCCSFPGLMCALLPSAIGGTLSETITQCCVLGT